MAYANDPLTTPSRITFAGDWHMNTRWAVAAIRRARQNGADVVVHTGDFGYAFAPRFLLPLSGVLEETGLELLFVDGNHEDHTWLSQIKRRSDGLGIVGSHIWHLPRGFRWNWDGVRFLALGGAHSVDRQARLQRNLMWHPEERISLPEAIAAGVGGPADVMVTHDCPAGVMLPGIDDRTGPVPFPAEEIATSQEHRELLRTVVDVVRPGVLFHGHYHLTHVQTVDLGWPMHVVGLDMDGTSMLLNTVTVDLDQLRPGGVASAEQLVFPHGNNFTVVRVPTRASGPERAQQ